MSTADSTAIDATGSLPSDGTACGAIAVDYRAALVDALACDPSTPDACTEWRPLTVATGSSTADARINGLCFTSGVGYVTPQHTQPLDAIIARYKDAGCAVSHCPGLPSILNQCKQNKAGRFTCGGM
jgi:hypothetical protein